METDQTPSPNVVYHRVRAGATQDHSLINTDLSPFTTNNSPLTTHRSPLTSLWRHRALIRQFAWREFRSRYVGSYFGLFWAVLAPALMLAVYTFIFRGVLHVQWD